MTQARPLSYTGKTRVREVLVQEIAIAGTDIKWSYLLWVMIIVRIITVV